MRGVLSWLFLINTWTINRRTSVLAQTSSASWIFPIVNHTTINNIDTIYLQWESNYASAFLQMWCQNDSDTFGNNVVLGSAFQVESSGSYGWVMDKDDSAQTFFPVACHAELASSPEGADGVDDPVGVTFTSQAGVAAQTFSSETTTVDSSTSLLSSSTTPTSEPPSPVSTASTVSVESTGSSESQSSKSTDASASNTQSTASTRSQSGITSLASSSSSTATSAPSTSISSGTTTPAPSSNLGAIIGGAIGGVALLFLIVFGVLFLRKYNQGSGASPSRRDSRSWWQRAYRTTEMQTAGLHEKDAGEIVRYEKDGTPVYEKEGSMPKRHEKEAPAPKRLTALAELPT